MMDARPRTIRDILYSGDQYIIPFFQRHYLWEKEHWDRLRKDIWTLMEDEAKNVHFLGPLVCTRTQNVPGAVTGYQLIDGQQRLTTLTVLLAALRDVAMTRKFTDIAEDVTENYLLHKRQQGTDRYKVLPRVGDREALTAIVEGTDATAFQERRIFQAWRYFRRNVEHWARKDAEARLRSLFDTVCHQLTLVVVTIDGENPYEIFESLNATGLPLEESDLIRNFLFMQIGLAKQQDFHDQQWKALEEMFDAAGDLPSVSMTPFYRDYLMREGRYSLEKSTFADFKQAQREAKFTPEQQVDELKHFAKLELMLRRPALVKNKALRRNLCQVEGMDITTAFALILNLLDRNEKEKLSEDELCGCLQDLVSFVLRRSLCGESTRPYNRWFVEAIGALRENPRQDLQAYWLKRRWPDDSTLKERIVDFGLYHREGAKARVILEAIEEAFDHKEPVDLSDPKIQVEHVLPQTISNNEAGRSWKKLLGDDWQNLHEKYVHTLGNLTLTGYNPSLSNSGFDTKKKLLKESHLELNKYFTDMQGWNADTVVIRSKKLADDIIRLWPRPPSNVPYTASAEAMLEPEGLSTAEKKRLEFWRHFDARLEERGISPAMVKPVHTSEISIPLGSTGYAQFEVGVYPQYNSIYVTLLLSGDIGDRVAERLQKEKSAIEAELGYQIHWDVEEGEADIYINDSDVQVWDKDDWPVQHDWLGDKLEDYLRVLKPRVEAYEREVLADPEIKQKVEKHQQLVDYWRDCGKAMQGASTSFPEPALARGRNTCRFEKIDTGIPFGAQCFPEYQKIYVYLGVTKQAGRKMRALFADLHNRETAALESELGVKLEWSDNYVWTSLSVNIDNKADWPRQHNWIRETAEKFSAVFKPRLGID
jgi:hypothetical protein